MIKSKTKQIVILAVIGIVLFLMVYTLSYLNFRSNNQKIWNVDRNLYIVFPEEKMSLYYFYRLASYLDTKITKIRFHIGDHKDSDGKLYGRWITFVEGVSMVHYNNMPERNEDLAKIEIDFPHVPLEGISSPSIIEPHLLEYLEAEGYDPDGDLEFLRTALVEKTIYWIWEFYSGNEKTYATASENHKGERSIGCDTDYYKLTPEQFILGDYHNCF